MLRSQHLLPHLLQLFRILVLPVLVLIHVRAIHMEHDLQRRVHCQVIRPGSGTCLLPKVLLLSKSIEARLCLCLRQLNCL